MSTLFLKLPSFATDYSGFLSTLYGIGGMMVVHDPSGCMGNYTNCDEPRWYENPTPVFTSHLREIEAVTGDTDVLIEKIVSTAPAFSPRFICILSTPVPSLIGIDLDEIAFRVQEALDIPCFGIPTTGLRFYHDGVKKALQFLYDNVILKTEKMIPNTVNVLGMTPLDYFTAGEDSRLRNQIEKCGCSVTAFLGMGGETDKITQAASAEKNIVMSMAGLPLARKMEKEHGIPYWMGPPVGETGQRDMEYFLTGSRRAPPFVPASGGGRALIVAEQAIGNALRRCLVECGGCSDVTVATLFEFSPEYAAGGDLSLRGEAQLRELLREDWAMVIGDPLFSGFCHEKTQFMPMPHPAVSSKLQWKNYISLID